MALNDRVARITPYRHIIALGFILPGDVRKTLSDNMTHVDLL